MNDIYETRRQRLRVLIDSRFSGTQSLLATHIDRQADYISRCLRGVKRIGEEFARYIETRCNLPSGWLDQAETEPSPLGKLPDTVHPVALKGEPSSPPDWQDFGEPLRLPPARAVPVVGTAQLGDNGHYVELEYPVGTGDGAVLALTNDPNAYAVRCRGDSMQPRLQHGEFAVIEPNHEVAPGDEVLVKSRDGRVMIKRLRYQRDGRIHLDSVNDATHPPVILEAADVAALHYVAAIVKSAYYRPA